MTPQASSADLDDQLAQQVAILVRLEEVLAVRVVVDEVIGDFAIIAGARRVRT